MAGRNLGPLFNHVGAGDEEDEFFGDGSQVGNYSPPTGFIYPHHPGGIVRPAVAGLVTPAAAAVVPPRAQVGLDLNSDALSLGDYQQVLQSNEPPAPTRRRSGKHVVAQAGRGRGAGGRGISSSAGIPPRPMKSGASRGAGASKRTKSMNHAAAAHSGMNIDMDDEDEGFYGSRARAADGSNIVLNSDEEEDDSDERGFDTAKWNEQRLQLFLKLVVREIGAGNRPNNQMASVGWKNICRDFRRSCGQNYNVKAMKNRYTQAKVLATFWKEVQLKASGLGRGPNGEIMATESWWQDNTKGRTECYRVFKDKVPPFLDDLMLIFDHVTVDGSSAYCPGFEEEENQPSKGAAGDLFDLTGEDDPYSPMNSSYKSATSGSKRERSTNTTAESPSKKTKSPMVKALRGLVAEIKIDREEGKQKEDNYARREEARSRAIVNAQAQIREQKKQAIQSEMDECVALAKECGIAEASVEMWVASELFMDSNKRAFFRAMTTPEVRFMWINMHCKQRGLL